MPANPDINSDRFSYLFDLALGELGATPPDLSETELTELLYLRQLFDVIDASWQVPEEQATRMHAMLLEQLTDTYPDHPWLKENAIHTLGDLVQAGRENMPILPAEVYQRLAADETPVEDLQDLKQRKRVLAQATSGTRLSDALQRDLVFWVNRTYNSFFSESVTPRVLYARRQGRSRKAKPDAAK